MDQIPKKVTKAIIPVAGYGTRRLPIVKAIEKCMLPVCNRPVVDYSVEECVLAGIEDIYFVVSPDFEQLRHYYSNNVPLEEYLAKRGKTAMLEELQTIPHKANFHYIVQDPSGAYGTAVPLWLARDAVGKDERFVLMFGDDFVFHAQPQAQNDLGNMKAAVQKYGTNGAILGIEMTPEEVSLYGSIKSKAGPDGTQLLDGIVEKPAPGTAPSNLASISYYILDNKVMPFVEEVLQEVNEHGEHFLTDAVSAYTAAGNTMVVVPSTGKHMDGGNLEGWIEANNTIFNAGR
jgi:UTP--glucose-1-phosphate uridylyltransferase